MKRSIRKSVRAFLLVACLRCDAERCSSSSAKAGAPAPIIIQDQGSFAVGGTVKTEPGTFDAGKPLEPAGQTYRGDHAYAFYQVPVNARRLPLVMWHGAGQFSKTWETTADGSEGFPEHLSAARHSTYLIDQPRRGNAGRTMVETTIKPTRMNNSGSASSASASGQAISTACSSHAIRTRSINIFER